MNLNRLQVGIDFSQKRADFCLLFPDGQPLVAHQAFSNSLPGYQKARQLLLDSLLHLWVTFIATHLPLRLHSQAVAILMVRSFSERF